MKHIIYLKALIITCFTDKASSSLPPAPPCPAVPRSTSAAYSGQQVAQVEQLCSVPRVCSATGLGAGPLPACLCLCRLCRAQPASVSLAQTSLLGGSLHARGRRDGGEQALRVFVAQLRRPGCRHGRASTLWTTTVGFFRRCWRKGGCNMWKRSSR